MIQKNENKVELFNFKELGHVRVVLKGGEPYFCLVDVCNILGIDNNIDVTKKLAESGLCGYVDSIDIPTFGTKASLTFIGETALYQVIFLSRKQIAQEFRLWVFEEVLLKIRKTGSYFTLNDYKGRNKILREYADVVYKIVNTLSKIEQPFCIDGVEE